MPFATIDHNFSYWRKQDRPLFDDLLWNIPEQKTGHIKIIGGNSQNFHTTIRIAEFFTQTFPLREVSLLLPDALRGQLPPLANLDFAPSTASGSFAKSPTLDQAFQSADFVLLPGDLSKNSATAIALSDAIAKNSTNLKPLLITRDAVDLLVNSAEALLPNPQVFLVASMVQLQKIFRAVYYPKMIMLSQPLIPVIETLHKFTLTYNAALLTFHEGQIIVANHGEIITTPLVNTDYSPINLWSGPLAAKIAALNLYSPNKPLEATAAAIFYH